MAAGATYEPIATQTLASATNTITFSSIPGTYTDLRIVASIAAPSGDNFGLRYNGITTSIYSQTILQGSGTVANSSRVTNNGFIYLNSGTTTGSFSQYEINIFNYANSTTNKTEIHRNSEVGTGAYVGAQVGLWRSTAAITSITIHTTAFSNMSVGSTFTLYGIAAA